MHDFNTADRQQNGFDLIPTGTVAPLVMTIRPGGAGEGGWLRDSQSSDAQMLDCEFTVESGPYARRKLWQMFTLTGGKLNEKGESIGGNISRAALRAILESARNIQPEDMSDAALTARRVNGWQDFCGITFWARLGVEKDKTGQYSDKNKIACVLTPDMKDYGKMSEAPAGHPGGSSSAAPAPAPAWGASAPVASPAPAPAQAPVQPSEATAVARASGLTGGDSSASAVPSQMPPTQAAPVPAWAR